MLADPDLFQRSGAYGVAVCLIAFALDNFTLAKTESFKSEEIRKARDKMFLAFTTANLNIQKSLLLHLYGDKLTEEKAADILKTIEGVEKIASKQATFDYLKTVASDMKQTSFRMRIEVVFAAVATLQWGFGDLLIGEIL